MPETTPLLSIVVGNYNYQEFVTTAVDSALRQTYARVEVIVVDDGSTDHSRKLLEQYRDRVTLIFKPNGGPTTTIHAGWAATSGEIVMFLDADDVLRDDAAETVVAAWRPDIVKVQFPLTVMDRDGRLQGYVPAPIRPLDEHQIRRLVRRWGIYPTPPTSGNAYSRMFLDKILPLDTVRFPNGADGALNAVAPLYGSVISLGTSLGYYRVHGKNHWAGAPLDATRFEAYLNLGRNEANFLIEHAALCAFPLSNADPLDHSLVFLERRLVLRKLAPSRPGSRRDHPIKLCVKACRCVRIYERSLMRSALTLIWFFMAAALPPAFALKMLGYRYAPDSRPSTIAFVARLARRSHTGVRSSPKETSIGASNSS